MTLALKGSSPSKLLQAAFGDMKLNTVLGPKLLSSKEARKEQMKLIGYPSGLYPTTGLKGCQHIPMSTKRVLGLGVQLYCNNLLEEYGLLFSECANPVQHKASWKQQAKIMAENTPYPKALSILMQINTQACQYIDSKVQIPPADLKKRIEELRLNHFKNIFALENEAGFVVSKNNYYRLGFGDRFGTLEREPDCMAYAFYHMHQEELFPYIFAPTVEPRDTKTSIEVNKYMNEFDAAKGNNSASDFLKRLAGWGYTQIDTPRPGDLVVYIQQNTEDRIVHYGIYLGDGKVRSKWHKDLVFTHGVNDLPVYFGDSVAFYRKKVIFKAVEELLKWDPTPLTDAGRLIRFKAQLMKTLNSNEILNVEMMIPNSLFGPAIIKRFGDEMWKVVEALQKTGDHKADANDNTKEKELSMYARLTALVRQVSDNLVPDIKLL